jgi:hypothetical protein
MSPVPSSIPEPLTAKEVRLVAKEVERQADVLTVLALMWLWANPEEEHA